MSSFSVLDSVLAKYEFAKFRNKKRVYFDYRYQVSDACLKYTYILQRIENYFKGIEENRDVSILEVGCGDGHLLKIISNEYGANCFGFDPILKSLRVKLLKFKRDKLRRRLYKVVPNDHVKFSMNNKNKFDIIYDACSLTHFNTNKFENINIGWKWALDYFPSILKTDGSFICATDTSEINPNFEFLESNTILNRFKRIGTINNLNLIESDVKIEIMNQEKFIDYNSPFIRFASADSKILLNVVGFEVKFN